VLKHGQFVPGIEDHDGLKRRRQVFGLAQHSAPLVEPGILIPVEVVDHRILFRMAGRRTAAGAAGTCCVLDCGRRSGQRRIDGGKVDAWEIFDVIDILAPDTAGGASIVIK